MLLMGTTKGSLHLYDSAERRRTTLVTRHAKRVTCAVWTHPGRVATAGLDKAVRSMSPHGLLMLLMTAAIVAPSLLSACWQD